MSFQPLIYFSVLRGADVAEPIFAECESGFDGDFSCLCAFNRIPVGYNEVFVVWYDLETQFFYRFSFSIPDDKAIEDILVMIVTQGAICLWLREKNQTYAVCEFDCEKTKLNDISDEWSDLRNDMQNKYDRQHSVLGNQSRIFHNAFRMLVRKYCYRYFPIVFGNKEMDLRHVDMTLADGTVLRMDDKGLFDYNCMARPKKMSLHWLMDKSDYKAYFWMDEKLVTAVFERFYGAHPETKADFIIRIDAENRKYGLALFRQGLREPVAIPEPAYQLIVFKNKFEDYRSENYDQPRGAWVW